MAIIRLIVKKDKLIRSRKYSKVANPDYVALFVKVDIYNPLNEVCGIGSVKKAKTVDEFVNPDNKAESICTLYVTGRGKLKLVSH